MAEMLGFTGWASSGKDTAALCLKTKGFTRMAFADPLRDLLLKINPKVQDKNGFGWCEWSKAVDLVGYEEARREYPESRDYLQRLGQALRDDDPYYWVKKAFGNIPEGNVVFSDVRYVEEWYAITGAGGKVYRIERPGFKAANEFEFQTHSLSEVADQVPIIQNDGTIGDLCKKVCDLVK